MKFSHNLHQYQVIEWAPFYIDYKGLKKLHKLSVGAAVERDESADFSGLSFILFESFVNGLMALQSSQTS
ncbi:hypothetical protein P7C71_g448, partial [Lecanoromycetidae sp. Uapishka_2]